MAMKEGELRSTAVFGSVEQAVREYQSKPFTPELVTKFYQTIWLERGKVVDVAFEVPLCPYTQEELTDLEKQGKRVGYLPLQLATQENRHILGKMFPNLQSHSVSEYNLVTNDENPSGWFDYETGIAPYLNTTEKQLTKKIAKDGRKLLSLNQYIIASQDSKLLTRQYLDEERAWKIRLGSRFGGRVVDANFNQGGYLGVDGDLKSGNHYQYLGGRSSGVKKA